MLKLSKLTDYGIVVMTHLAQEPYQVHAAGDVAVATRVAVPTVSKVLKDKGKYNCLWNLDPKDWAEGSTPEKAADYIIKNARKGSTVVVHLQHLGKDAKQLSRIKNGLAKRGIELCAPMKAPTPKKLPSVLCS